MVSIWSPQRVKSQISFIIFKSQSPVKLAKTIDAAIKFQKLVVKEGIGLMERKEVNPNSSFRYAIMN